MANEKRLIDANALIEEANAEGAYGYVDAFQIANAPTIDAVPVRHGRWIKVGYACGEGEYQCSECKETEWRTSASRLKYCPFCGAKMDKRDE